MPKHKMIFINFGDEDGFEEFQDDFIEDMLVSYADVALNGTKHTLHDYSPEIGKNLIIHCYQPEPGYCACVLQVTDQ